MRVRLHKKHQLIPPAKGRVLIAEPFAQDIYFSHSIVLVVDAGNGGHMGFVVNKPINERMGHFFSKYGLDDVPIYRGGPVDEDRLFYLHNIPGIQGAVEICEGLYVGGVLLEVTECLKISTRRYKAKFFRGYTGWSAGQLDNEIKDESWVVSELDVDVLDLHQEELWKSSLLAIDDDYYTMWVHFPFDPQSN